MGPRLLAFDTSTEQMALALHDGQRAHCREEAGGALASARLLPALHELLQEAGLAWRALDAIAFGRGPGAFTGLRTSCAVAQGLAFGLERPVLPIDSLLIVAEDAHEATGALDIGVLMDARMDEVYLGRYRRSDGRWQASEANALCSLAAAVERWPEPPACLAGNAQVVFGPRLALDGPWHAPRPGRAAALLRLAQQAWDEGRRVRADEALPLYLRDKVALTTHERESLRAAAAPR